MLKSTTPTDMNDDLKAKKHRNKENKIYFDPTRLSNGLPKAQLITSPATSVTRTLSNPIQKKPTVHDFAYGETERSTQNS